MSSSVAAALTEAMEIVSFKEALHKKLASLDTEGQEKLSSDYICHMVEAWFLMLANAVKTQIG